MTLRAFSTSARCLNLLDMRTSLLQRIADFVPCAGSREAAGQQAAIKERDIPAGSPRPRKRSPAPYSQPPAARTPLRLPSAFDEGPPLSPAYIPADTADEPIPLEVHCFNMLLEAC